MTLLKYDELYDILMNIIKNNINPTVKKETCIFYYIIVWVINSIIISNYPEGINRLLNNNLLNECITIINNGTFNQQKEVVFIIHALCLIDDKKYMEILFKMEIPKILLSLLKVNDVDLLFTLLYIYDINLSCINNAIKYFENLNIIELLENIQFSINLPENLQKYAKDIVDKYYGENYGIDEEI